jgi:transposase
MAKALSVDLRERVVAAVSGGLSCRAAALQFRVSASSAIRWAALARQTGGVAPKRQGGDHRSARIEAQAPLILGMVMTTPDVTLTEMRSRLAERGIGVGIGSLWRFFARRHITLKKRPGTRRSKIAPIS